jgi:phosphoserine phosphatase RsbU/P
MEKRILVVDDDQNIRKVLEMHLTKAGYTVEHAENGKRCLQLLAENPPDLVLLDLLMPVMDGMETVKEIRKNYKRGVMPVIMLSAEQDKKSWAKVIQAGANDFVPKPFDKTELLARIGTNLTVGDLNSKLYQLTRDLAQKNQELENEKKLASRIQRVVIPEELNFDSIDMEAFYQPSSKMAGDFYDAFKIGDRIIFMIGDVAELGTSAALIMFAAKSILNSFGKANKPAEEIIGLTNRIIVDMLGNSDLYLTLVFGIFDEKTKQVSMISAGHIPVYYMRQTGIYTIESNGPAIGIDKKSRWTPFKKTFAKGDSLFLYTNGLVAAQDESGLPFGRKQLNELLKYGRSSEDQVNIVSQEVMKYCNNKFEDDITILALRRK